MADSMSFHQVLDLKLQELRACAVNEIQRLEQRIFLLETDNERLREGSQMSTELPGKQMNFGETHSVRSNHSSKSPESSSRSPKNEKPKQRADPLPDLGAAGTASLGVGMMTMMEAEDEMDNLLSKIEENSDGGMSDSLGNLLGGDTEGAAPVKIQVQQSGAGKDQRGRRPSELMAMPATLGGNDGNSGPSMGRVISTRSSNSAMPGGIPAMPEPKKGAKGGARGSLPLPGALGSAGGAKTDDDIFAEAATASWRFSDNIPVEDDDPTSSPAAKQPQRGGAMNLAASFGLGSLADMFGGGRRSSRQNNAIDPRVLQPEECAVIPEGRDDDSDAGKKKKGGLLERSMGFLTSSKSVSGDFGSRRTM
eukprot:gnl/TRDRNA2_/TRDRNA2_160236_c0_seq1.p1 gnl/TRDRNA2_/TRDRNA2_160236_c0~~gnl/TRDRNA2_/TRDRNA2_160236_c0_seq1.p1  ORF type:complete len:365 (+),score=76.78 gnl/TRDRNA2_/TRDRNA2_160236_c0_seq1:109-1203(+)